MPQRRLGQRYQHLFEPRGEFGGKKRPRIVFIRICNERGFNGKGQIYPRYRLLALDSEKLCGQGNSCGHVEVNDAVTRSDFRKIAGHYGGVCFGVFQVSCRLR